MLFRSSVVEAIPLTSIVLETDCPYLAPEPNRGKRNESAYIQYVAEEIARELGITTKTVEYHIRTALAELRKIIAAIIVFF